MLINCFCSEYKIDNYLNVVIITLLASHTKKDNFSSIKLEEIERKIYWQ